MDAKEEYKKIQADKDKRICRMSVFRAACEAIPYTGGDAEGHRKCVIQLAKAGEEYVYGGL
jgi:hypothetical protein